MLYVDESKGGRWLVTLFTMYYDMAAERGGLHVGTLARCFASFPLPPVRLAGPAVYVREGFYKPVHTGVVLDDLCVAHG